MDIELYFRRGTMGSSYYYIIKNFQITKYKNAPWEKFTMFADNEHMFIHSYNNL